MSEITIMQGDDRVLLCDAYLAGVPYALDTLPKVWFTAKKAITDADGSAQIAKTQAAGITFTTGPKSTVNNRAQITIAPTDTSALQKQRTELFYDVQVKDGSSKIYTIASGKLIVEPHVTQAVS